MFIFIFHSILPIGITNYTTYKYFIYATVELYLETHIHLNWVTGILYIKKASASRLLLKSDTGNNHHLATLKWLHCLLQDYYSYAIPSIIDVFYRLDKMLRKSDSSRVVLKHIPLTRAVDHFNHPLPTIRITIVSQIPNM